MTVKHHTEITLAPFRITTSELKEVVSRLSSHFSQPPGGYVSFDLPHKSISFNPASEPAGFDELNSACPRLMMNLWGDNGAIFLHRALWRYTVSVDSKNEDWCVAVASVAKSAFAAHRFLLAWWIAGAGLLGIVALFSTPELLGLLWQKAVGHAIPHWIPLVIGAPLGGFIGLFGYKLIGPAGVVIPARATKREWLPLLGVLATILAVVASLTTILKNCSGK